MPDGTQLIRSDTNDVWMLGRTLVGNSGDLEAARKIQEQIQLLEVAGRGPVRQMTSLAEPVPDAEMFLNVVNEILGRSPTNLGQAQRAKQFSSVGIKPGDTAALLELPEQVRLNWVKKLPQMLKDLRRGSSSSIEVEAGWQASSSDVGNFGENDALRASVALSGLAGLPAEEAGYFRTYADADGERLEGRQSYEFRIPSKGVPADAFWSVTMYSEEPDGRRFLVENPISRYAISDRTPGLIYESDGSLLIYLQHTEPQGSRKTNWLPAPQGFFTLSFRAYLPRKEIREGKWSPPPLTITS